MSLETTPCVVLNATYQPMTVVNAKRGLILYLEGKATIIKEHPELVVRSPNQTFPLPTMILVKEYIKGVAFRSTALLTQKNLFIRDNYTCQYCNRHRRELRDDERLTRDHVHPRKHGGRDVWENVVTACGSCNSRKASKKLGETTMKLIRQPYAPSQVEILMSRYPQLKDLPSAEQ